MWTYVQSTGIIRDPGGLVLTTGYSGQPPYANSPADEWRVGLGPIPAGTWDVTALAVTTENHGPYVLFLDPRSDVNLYLRDGTSFRVHGERLAPPPGFASEGCIVAARLAREAIWTSTDHVVKVIPV